MKRLDPGKPISNELGDFTTTPRLLRISALALSVGAISAFVALGLLKLIALFTNITMRAADPSQRLFPVVDQQAHLSGVLTWKDLQNVAERAATILEVTKKDVVTAFPDEPLRVVVYRMAETGLTRMPVVARGQPLKLVGMISLSDL